MDPCSDGHSIQPGWVFYIYGPLNFLEDPAWSAASFIAKLQISPVTCKFALSHFLFLPACLLSSMPPVPSSGITWTLIRNHENLTSVLKSSVSCPSVSIWFRTQQILIHNHIGHKWRRDSSWGLNDAFRCCWWMKWTMVVVDAAARNLRRRLPTERIIKSQFKWTNFTYGHRPDYTICIGWWWWWELLKSKSLSLFTGDFLITSPFPQLAISINLTWVTWEYSLDQGRNGRRTVNTLPEQLKIGKHWHHAPIFEHCNSWHSSRDPSLTCSVVVQAVVVSYRTAPHCSA